MTRPRMSAAGGMPAMWYVLRKARDVGPLRLWQRLRSRNACKTCAVGMGGQVGGMANESRHFPEVCKKSVQAQAGDMQAPIAPAFFARTSLAALERLDSRQMEQLGRLTFPIVAAPGDTHFRRVSWEHAHGLAAAALRAAPPSQTFFYASGRASNEAAFLMQLVARAHGTPHIHNCSFYCHQASSVALQEVFGNTTASICLDDLERTDLALVVGANPASNHPRLITQLLKLRRRGGKVIVVNPIRELGLSRFRVPSDWRSMLFGSRVADVYLQAHIGADVAVMKALLKALMATPGGIDHAFVADHTDNFALLRDDVARTPWTTLIAHSGLARRDIEHAAHLLYGAERGIVMWAMGLTHHAHGVNNILAAANVALARGWLGRPGAGLLPIRGHSNVQGVGSMGVSPAVKAVFATRLEEAYGIAVPREPGQDTHASMVAAHAGDVRASVWLGGNLYGSNPDSLWAAAALRRIGTTLSVTTKLNGGHVHGRAQTMIIVPARTRDEESQATTQESMFNYVRLSDGGAPLHAGEQRSEVDILASLAEAILPAGRFDWAGLRSHATLRAAMARVVEGYAPVAAIERTGEFNLATRVQHTPHFSTTTGRAAFHVTPLPELPELSDTRFRLMTLRSEGQFNTVVYDHDDLYRGVTRRDVIMMSAADGARLGLREGDPVHVRTAIGAVRVVAAFIDIRPGNVAMYYPEANAIVPQKLDARSKTPSFKCIPATLQRLTEPPPAR